MRLARRRAPSPMLRQDFGLAVDAARYAVRVEPEGMAAALALPNHQLGALGCLAFSKFVHGGPPT